MKIELYADYNIITDVFFFECLAMCRGVRDEGREDEIHG